MNETENSGQLSMLSAEPELYGSEEIEVDDSFFDDDLDVVRAEYVPDSNDPTISFNNCQLYVNMACIKQFPEIDYVQILINKTKNQLGLLPCNEDERDALLWRTINRKSGKRQPKHMTAHILSAMLFEYMGWDMRCRYSLMGKIKISRGIPLIAFDLGAYKAHIHSSSEDDTAVSNQGYFPSDWKGRFGLPFKEHQKIMEVATFKSYATISISDNNCNISEETTGEKDD